MQILVGEAGGQLYALDKRYVDPRRPPRGHKPTADEAEERLPPYAEVLPIFAPLYASYDKKVRLQSAVRFAAATARPRPYTMSQLF